MDVQLTLKDGKVLHVPAGTTGFDVAGQIGAGLQRAALAFSVDGKVMDLTAPIEAGGAIVFLTYEDEAGRTALRHTASHVLAQAVKRLFGNTVKLAIGPVIDTGYYYDFDPATPFTPDDLARIEQEMEVILREDLPVARFTLPRDQALAWADEQDEPYKRQLIEDLPPDSELSFYRQGEFTDLCAGPHLPSTGRVRHVKLLSLAGAYWRGNEKNKMLQRVYGTASESRQEIDQWLQRLEDARNRDHRKLGKELDLFSIDEYVGAGLVLWHPKLSVVREEIEAYWRREHRRRGYEYLYTPHIGQSRLWETSGHLDHFADGMYPPMQLGAKDADEDAAYYVKPMSCPFHVRIYKSRPRSYRELPLRWCELGSVYRFEKSGALHGMLRVRGFTQDDAHVICSEDQFVSEVNGIIDFALSMNHTFGFDQLKVYLSVRDPDNAEKYIPNEPVWQLAEHTLESILQDRGIAYQKDVGGAKFYGPAIDLKAVDALGREWQGTTIQLDMNLPERFGMSYVGADGREHTPIMLHRTLLGSMERFVGTLIEHYAGAFPTWLAPEQVRILTITGRADEWAESVRKLLWDQDIRVTVDSRNEKIGAKIRDARLEKIPNLLVIGDREAESGLVAVRTRGEGDLGVMAPEAFLQRILTEIRDRTIG